MDRHREAAERGGGGGREKGERESATKNCVRPFSSSNLASFCAPH